MIGAPTTTRGRLLRVRNWAERYETHESRKVKNLQWVPLRNDVSDPGFVVLMGMPDGAAMFGAWSALLMMAARCHVRGTFADENGNPYSAAVIASVIRVNLELLERTIEVLTGEIPWFEWVESGQPGQSPGSPAESPGNTADHAGSPGLHNSTGQDTDNSSCCCSCGLEDSSSGSPGDHPGIPADVYEKWKLALPTCERLAKALFKGKRLSPTQKEFIAKAGYLAVDRGEGLLEEVFERFKTAEPNDAIRFASKILDDHCQRKYERRLAALFAAIDVPAKLLETRHERNGQPVMAS